MFDELGPSLIIRALIWILLIVGIALLVTPDQYTSLIPLVAVAGAISLSVDYFIGE